MHRVQLIGIVFTIQNGSIQYNLLEVCTHLLLRNGHRHILKIYLIECVV